MSVDRWDQRQLCPDGGCIGVIGPDGTCKMCGRAAPNWGDERKRGLIEPDDDDDDAADAPPVVKQIVVSSRSRAGGEWNERRLCSEGTCIGVIGPDGNCKLCGKKAEPLADERDFGGRSEDDDEDKDGKRDAAHADDDDADGDDASDSADDDDDDADGGDDDDDADDDDADDDDADDDDAADDADQAGGARRVVARAGGASATGDDADPAAGGASATNDDADEDDDEDDDGDDDDDEGDEDGNVAKTEGAAIAAAIADEERKLCPDGACVGLIGANGKCKICGKEAA